MNIEAKFTFYFRLDFGGLIGRGHLARCLSLANCFKAKGCQSVFVIRKRPGLPDVTIDHGIVWLKEADSVLSSDTESWRVGTEENEAEEMNKILPEKAFIILDHYALKANWQRELKKNGHTIFLFQDFFTENFEADFLLNYNIEAKKNYSQSFVSGKSTAFLLGPEYAPLSLEYQNEHEMRFFSNRATQTVGFYFGGIAKENLLKMAETVSEIEFFQNKTLEWVVGDADSQLLLENKLGPRVHVLRNLKSLLPLYKKSDLFIGACGVGFLERACLGIWQINFKVADNQKEIAAGISSVLDLGPNNSSQIRTFLREELREEKRTFQLKEAQSFFNAVDGAGCERIYNAILQGSKR